MAKKTNAEDFVKFARSKIGTNYVYGMKGTVMTRKQYDDLKARYKDYVWDSDVKKCNTVCCDCSGMLYWGTGVQRGSSQWYEKATERHPISTAADAPIGAMVWCKGHIGVISKKEKGVVYYIAADGSAYGIREVPLSKNRFTHWMLDTNVFDYSTDNKEDDEVIVKDTVVVNGVEHKVEMIRKDGYTFLKTRDIAELLNVEVDFKGKTPVLKTK